MVLPGIRKDTVFVISDYNHKVVHLIKCPAVVYENDNGKSGVNILLEVFETAFIFI
jgi:hypothetical protein